MNKNIEIKEIDFSLNTSEPVEFYKALLLFCFQSINNLLNIINTKQTNKLPGNKHSVTNVLSNFNVFGNVVTFD